MIAGKCGNIDFATVLDEQSYADFAGAMRQGQSLMHRRTLWHVNATLKLGWHLVDLLACRSA